MPRRIPLPNSRIFVIKAFINISHLSNRRNKYIPIIYSCNKTLHCNTDKKSLVASYAPSILGSHLGSRHQSSRKPVQSVVITICCIQRQTHFQKALLSPNDSFHLIDCPVDCSQMIILILNKANAGSWNDNKINQGCDRKKIILNTTFLK